MPLTPIDGTAELRSKPQHPEKCMLSDRLAIRIERHPLEGMEACNGMYMLTENLEGIDIKSAGHTLFVRTDIAKDLADALYRYVQAIEADRDRYVKARETIGRRIRNGELPGFEDARIRIETERG